MSRYLDDEAIARALNVEVDLVRGVLSGNVLKVEDGETVKASPVRFFQTAFRQKVIAIVRSAGGAGSTFLAVNLARHIADMTGVLLIDLCASISTIDYVVSSDVLDAYGMDSHPVENWQGSPEVMEIDSSLHYLPCPVLNEGPAVSEAILKARQEYDAIIIDLPNYFDDRVLEATGLCTTLLILYGGGVSEARRLIDLACRLPAGNRDKVLVTCGRSLSSPDRGFLLEKLMISRHVHLPREDKPGTSGLVSRKSRVYAGITGLVSQIYGGQLVKKEGLISKIFNTRG
jgi:hypothetical protein